MRPPIAKISGWIWFIIGVLLFLFLVVSCSAQPRQTQPDPKRIARIREALVEHGYEPGKTWPQTREILKQIAQDHKWQSHRVPDARVLIFLGLGNSHSDPEILDLRTNHLDYLRRQ